MLGTAVTGEADPFTGYDAACGWQVTDDRAMLVELSIEVGRLDAASIEQEFAASREHMPAWSDASAGV